jgi:hypothetical protein
MQYLSLFDKTLKKRNRICKIKRTLGLAMLMLLSGLIVSYTSAAFNTYAKTTAATAAAAENMLATQGSFNYSQWMSSPAGQSGLIVTNVSSSKVWVYFTVAGNLSGAIQPLNPVELAPQEAYNIPLMLADVGELGLLQWRNQGTTFSGTVTVGLLNNYASYTVGTVNLTGQELYAQWVKDQDDPGGRLAQIKAVKDILALCNQITTLLAEVQSLGQQVASLNQANNQLISENNNLAALVKSLQAVIAQQDAQLTPSTTPAASAVGSNTTAGSGASSTATASGSTNGTSAAESSNTGTSGATSTDSSSTGVSGSSNAASTTGANATSAAGSGNASANTASGNQAASSSQP